ncbi:conserved hypothetical protein [Leishmania major strain Friedlin]|uniref:Uncharacterized protein n=1 Tax=Leishmania major TaxID=5664 RepID=E9ACC7_LEIMA|nr:conserved hypothetical protein [Leishmania major strain Friedlin]CAG9567206.1 hypothetical_protein_-_conserved [Leishmania major strain Friedlin]CBZ11943.1 conserved hypothetical protein [Leishmania major strain Friedlin]|eukprot:XP_003721658.1 conserved hypothetical protein [Leishmania major strain Friedlin]
MSAVSPPSGQLAQPTAFIATPSGFNASGAAPSFVKVYCGNDECVPFSKQCTSDVFQGVLSDLANRVSKHEAQDQASRSHRVKTVGSAAAADGAASASGTVAGSGGSDGKGESTPPASEDRVGTAGTRSRVVKGGGAGAKKKQSAPPLSTSPPLLLPSKGVAPAAPSTEPFHSTNTSPTTDTAAALVGDPLAGESGVRVACDVYRRAELLPLSFVREVASNSRVTALYKQHLQLQEELQRHQLEQQQIQQQREEDDDAASAAAAKAAKNDAADAASNQSTAGRAGGKGGKTPSSKPAPRRCGMPSVGRAGSAVSGNRVPCSASSAATSAVAATALAAQIRTQLWTALRNTIPFFGVLTMPVHTPMEPLISLPASASASGASTAAARAAAATTTPPAAGVASAATAVCSGSYVLLGCRERPREERISADASPVASQAGRCASGALSVIGGAAACASMSTVERLVEQAHEASVTRLPPLSSDAVLRSNGGTNAFGANGEGGKRSPRKQRLHPRDLQAQMSQQSLPLRCTLHPTTNRVVPMLPPLPDDIAAGYGSARLVTRSLGPSAADPSGDADDSTTPSGTYISRIAANGRGCGNPDRAHRRSLDEPADDFVSAVSASAAAGLRRPLSSCKDALPTGVAKGSAGAGPLSDEVGIEGDEEATLMNAQQPSNAAAASYDPLSPSTLLHASSAVGPSGSTHRDGDGPGKGMEPGVPLSAAAIARLAPSTRFTVQLSSCSVTLTTQPRKGAGMNAADAASANTTGAANSISGTGRIATGCGEVDTYADELTLVFDGLDVLWHGPNGEEALLQWVLDEYSILLKQRMAAAMAQWTSMVHARDTSAGAASESSSKANKMRRQLPSERVRA